MAARLAVQVLLLCLLLPCHAVHAVAYCALCHTGAGDEGPGVLPKGRHWQSWPGGLRIHALPCCARCAAQEGEIRGLQDFLEAATGGAGPEASPYPAANPQPAAGAPSSSSLPLLRIAASQPLRQQRATVRDPAMGPARDWSPGFHLGLAAADNVGGPERGHAMGRGKQQGAAPAAVPLPALLEAHQGE